MKKLYVVSVVKMVVAESEDEAYAIATRPENENRDDGTVIEIRNSKDFSNHLLGNDRGWFGAEPYASPLEGGEVKNFLKEFDAGRSLDDVLEWGFSSKNQGWYGEQLRRLQNS